MAELNTDILKRTDGLLAEIDRTLAAPSIAERVDRLLQSACSEIRVTRYESFEAWEAYERGVSEHLSFEERDALGGDVIDPYSCGCDYVSDPDEPLRQVAECAIYDPPAENPIMWTVAPYLGGAGAATEPCGAVDCACMDLLAYPMPPAPPRPVARRTVLGPRYHFTIMDEVAEIPEEALARLREITDRHFAEALAEGPEEPPRAVATGRFFEEQVRQMLQERADRMSFLDVRAD